MGISVCWERGASGPREYEEISGEGAGKGETMEGVSGVRIWGMMEIVLEEGERQVLEERGRVRVGLLEEKLESSTEWSSRLRLESRE